MTELVPVLEFDQVAQRTDVLPADLKVEMDDFRHPICV